MFFVLKSMKFDSQGFSMNHCFAFCLSATIKITDMLLGDNCCNHKGVRWQWSEDPNAALFRVVRQAMIKYRSKRVQIRKSGSVVSEQENG